MNNSSDKLYLIKAVHLIKGYLTKPKGDVFTSKPYYALKLALHHKNYEAKFNEFLKEYENRGEL